MSSRVTQLDLLAEPAPLLWRHVPVEYPPAARLADRHYSRQTIGAKGVISPGERFLLWYEDVQGAAVWGVTYNRFRGQWRWRNGIFRNESGQRSSTLVIAASITTMDVWARRYRRLPPQDLTTEIDILATAKRRSRRHPPGHCYLIAGWRYRYTRARTHGRPAVAVLAMPIPPAWWLWTSYLALALSMAPSGVKKELPS